MRPLPTYRIEPPDIIQIEVTSAKAARGGENQPSKKSDEKTSSVGAATESGSSSLNVTGAITPVENKVGSGQVSGKIMLSGTPAETKNATVVSAPAENVAGNTTVPTGTLTFNDVEPVAGEPLNKFGGGSLILGKALNKTGTATITLSGPNTYTLSGPNTYSGTTATFSAANNYAGTTSVSSDNTYVLVGDKKPGATTVTDGSEMRIWQPGMQTLALDYASPSADSITLKRTNRGMSGAALGTGQYLVGPDGTINMRQYGTVQVMGMTIAEVKAALEKHLSSYMESPEVWVDVSGYNSKVFYVITDGAGSGDNVRRIPICGNETVLDALAAIGGLSQFSSKKIWISRPSPTNSKKGTILTVDYAAITQRGATETNYQIMPGDRIFIAPDSAIAINVKLGKVTAPMERVMGLIGLGTSTIRSVKKLMGDEKDHQGAEQEDW
jgi:protein involved in polysaccharide export with SLBB domain